MHSQRPLLWFSLEFFDFFQKWPLPMEAYLVQCVAYGTGWNHQSRLIQVTLKLLQSVFFHNLQQPSQPFLTEWKCLNSFKTVKLFDDIANCWNRDFKIFYNCLVAFGNDTFLIIGFLMVSDSSLVLIIMTKKSAPFNAVKPSLLGYFRLCEHWKWTLIVTS